MSAMGPEGMKRSDALDDDPVGKCVVRRVVATRPV